MRPRCLCETLRLGISETLSILLAQSGRDSSSGASETLGGKTGLKIANGFLFFLDDDDPRRVVAAAAKTQPQQLINVPHTINSLFLRRRARPDPERGLRHPSSARGKIGRREDRNRGGDQLLPLSLFFSPAPKHALSQTSGAPPFSSPPLLVPLFFFFPRTPTPAAPSRSPQSRCPAAAASASPLLLLHPFPPQRPAKQPSPRSGRRSSQSLPLSLIHI